MLFFIEPNFTMGKVTFLLYDCDTITYISLVKFVFEHQMEVIELRL
jgi:hypothetical protein